MKTALVTGGNRGIGYEIAKGLANDGFLVFLTSRSFANAQEAADTISQETFPLQVDVSNEESILRALNIVNSQVDHLDVLVNNAGIMGSSPLNNFDLVEMEEVWQINSLGALKMIKHFKSLLDLSDRPRIINMSSGMGELAGMQQGGHAAYRHSKWSLNGLSFLLAAELPKKFFVASMSPGWCKTEMGGNSAPRSAAEGADTAIWLATQDQLPTGQFWYNREPVRW